jgi:bla regulator protein blaR1
MLQSLLEDRFQLLLHRESKELPVYALVPPKGGIELRTSWEGDCMPQTRSDCGGMMTSPRSISATAISMEQFTTALSNTMQRTVIDKTGFAGKFDVHLEWAADQSTLGLWAPGLKPLDLPSPADGSVPAIFTVLQEKLKLESSTGPVPILVIDHAVKPSPN